MALYQDNAKARIKKTLRKFKPIAEQARRNALNEADTRLIVTAILDEALGWNTFDDISSEQRIKGQYCDFAIKAKRGYLAIIEVKSAGTPLSPKHLYQAVGYAANEGVDWVILTNGADWHLYRVVFGKPVSNDLVFEVSLLDEETPPAKKAELLYLISREAQRGGDLDAYYKKKSALCGTNVAKVLLSEKMLKSLRLEMRRLTGHSASPQEIATILVEEVFRLDVQGDDTARLIKKAADRVRAVASKASPRQSESASAPSMD
jgi:predicted type IV restriction endonuclease